MSDIIKELKEYLNNASEEQLKKDWEKYKHYNNIGPTVEEYLAMVKKKENVMTEEETMRYLISLKE